MDKVLSGNHASGFTCSVNISSLFYGKMSVFWANLIDTETAIPSMALSHVMAVHSSVNLAIDMTILSNLH